MDQVDVEAAHSDIGPSSSDRWMNCPRSVALSRDPRAKATKVGESAAQGTVAHGLIEWAYTQCVDDMGVMARIGEVVEQDGHEITIDEEMVMHVLEFGRYIKERVAAIGPRSAVNEWTETKVGLYSVDPLLWGTADKIIFDIGNILIVDDFKYGKGKRVSAVENPQLGIYILAALEEIGKSPEAFPTIEGVISQPRNGGTTSWFPTKEWLAAFKQKVKDAIALTRLPDAPIKAGDWCTFCKAKSFCPEIQRVASEETQTDFSMAPVPGALARVETMPPWKVSRILDHQDMIESWLSSVRSLAQQMLESGQQVPGYKLVDGRTSRKWKDGDGETAAAKYQIEYGDKVFAPRKVKSVAQMETLVGKKNFDANLYETTPGHKKVANDADPRPETMSTAQSEFDTAPAPGALPPVDPLFTPNPDFFAAPAPRLVQGEVVEKPRGPIWPV